MDTLTKRQSTRSQIEDIAVDISCAKISKRYFGRSASWIYNKIAEIDGNGNKGGFTEEEKDQFKKALLDLSDRIRRIAENFN